MRYAVALSVLGEVVFADTIEASSPAAAKAAWEQKFFNSVEDFQTEIPLMDATNKACAEKMLASMIAKRDLARAWGHTVTARASRAKNGY